MALNLEGVVTLSIKIYTALIKKMDTKVAEITRNNNGSQPANPKCIPK